VLSEKKKKKRKAWDLRRQDHGLGGLTNEGDRGPEALKKTRRKRSEKKKKKKGRGSLVSRERKKEKKAESKAEEGKKKRQVEVFGTAAEKGGPLRLGKKKKS